MLCRHGKIWWNRSIDVGATIPSHWIQSTKINPRHFLLLISFIQTVVGGKSKGWLAFKGSGRSHSKTKNNNNKVKKKQASKQKIRRSPQVSFSTNRKRNSMNPLKTKAHRNVPHAYSTLRHPLKTHMSGVVALNKDKFPRPEDVPFFLIPERRLLKQ